MRALVTGGTGFVGSAVVRALLDAGVQVRCLVRAGSPHTNLDGLDIELCTGDLCAAGGRDDADSLARAVRGCQELYHVAALYSTRPEDAEAMFQVNVEGTRRLLTAAAEAGLSRIVHTSTIGTIGRPATERLPNEDDELADVQSASPYARSKLEGERAALELAAHGAPVVVVNPCAPVGARDGKPSSTGARILACLQGRTPSFTPGGINFVAVQDVAQGHLLAAARGQPGRRYILGNAQGNLTLDDFVALMERVSGVSLPGNTTARAVPAWRTLASRVRRALAPRRPAQPGFRPAALTADPSRAIRELGLPQTPLEAAFREAVEWYRAHGYIGA